MESRFDEIRSAEELRGSLEGRIAELQPARREYERLKEFLASLDEAEGRDRPAAGEERFDQPVLRRLPRRGEEAMETAGTPCDEERAGAPSGA